MLQHSDNMPLSQAFISMFEILWSGKISRISGLYTMLTVATMFSVWTNQK